MSASAVNAMESFFTALVKRRVRVGVLPYSDRLELLNCVVFSIAECSDTRCHSTPAQLADIVESIQIVNTLYDVCRTVKGLKIIGLQESALMERRLPRPVRRRK